MNNGGRDPIKWKILISKKNVISIIKWFKKWRKRK